MKTNFKFLITFKKVDRNILNKLISLRNLFDFALSLDLGLDREQILVGLIEDKDLYDNTKEAFINLLLEEQKYNGGLVGYNMHTGDLVKITEESLARLQMAQNLSENDIKIDVESWFD